MIVLLLLWPVLLATAAQTLTIDSQLGTSVEDCFERITLGERLPFNAIYRNISELSTRECEKICKQDRQCQSFDYGVGAKGNATCNLSSVGEDEIRTANTLQKHPEYDVYVRRFNCEQSPPTPLFNDDSNIPNKPVIRPGHFEDPPEKAPLRPIYDENRPIQHIQKPLYDLKPYDTNNWPTRPYVNKVPYGRPIKHQYDNNYYKPKPSDYYDTSRPPLPAYDHRPGDGDGYKPSYNNDIDYERPDDYGAQKPEFDRPVGYGSHISQDIPFKPRPIYNRPLSYRPISSYNQTIRPTKPDPNDVLHFQNNYNFDHNRPTRPETWRPDPNYPSRPYDEVNDIYALTKPIKPYQKPSNYVPVNEVNHYQKPFDDQKPSYEYYVRPNKKPYYTQHQKPQNQVSGYGNRPDPIDSEVPYDPPGYGSPGPMGPPIEKPLAQNRPHDHLYDSNKRPSSYYTQNDNYQSSNNYQKPSYDSHFNYAGQTHKPSKPNRPVYDYHSSGYSTQNPGQYQFAHDSHTHSGYGHSSTGLSDSVYDGNQNVNLGYDGNIGSSNYGGQSEHLGYGNHDTTEDYGNQNSYGGSGGHSGSYGNQDTQTGYGNRDKPSSNNYGEIQSSGYGIQNPQSGYGSQTQKPTSSNYGQTSKPSASFDSHRPSSPKPGGVKPVHEYEPDEPIGENPGYGQRPVVEVVSSKPVSIGGVTYHRPPYAGPQDLKPNFSACYRRVLAGRRALRSNVRRVLPCERLDDCQRECAEERRFHCETFNYKLDPSFRGKGLCELMTKPIEHFDLQRDFVDDRDYDFYELDRNSLQPECNLNWHGPPLAHSGYLGGSVQDWRPGYDQNDGYRRQYDRRRDHHHYRHSYGSYGQKENRKRWDDRNFVPYQIGIGRSNDEDWGQYGGSYGNNDYDKNDHVNSLSYWGLDNEEHSTPDSFYGVRPHGPNNDFNYYNLGNQRFNGNAWDSYSYGYGGLKKWNHSAFHGTLHGNTGLIYGESNYYGPNHLHGDHGSNVEESYGSHSAYDCSSRRRAGMSLGSGVIRRSLLAHNVLDCESACFRETGFKCVSYSYRYSKSHVSENCFLSETPYRGLDLTSDSGSDVYSMANHKQCTVSAKPWIESECFLHVRSGKAVTGSAVKAALSVAGLGACEAECIRAQGFFCRGFSFRFDPPTIGDNLENCLLTSSPPSALRQLRPAPSHELYARGNYGRGCEPDLTEDPEPGGPHCYLQYDNAARLLGAAARGRARVHDEAACAAACTEAPFRCLSFSYSTSSPLQEENCLLSEIRLFDLKLGVDYEHSEHDWLFAFDLFNKECWRKITPEHAYGENDRNGVHTPEVPRPILPQHLPEPVPLPPSGPAHIPGYPSGPGTHGLPGHPGSHRQEYPSHPSAPGYFPHSTGSDYHPGHFVTEIARPSGSGGFRPSGYLPESPIPGPPGSGFRPGYQPEQPSVTTGPSGIPSYAEPQVPGYLPNGGNKGFDDVGDQYPISWRHYTVSGFPCRRGTVCAQNVVAGHWSCEPEGGEVGSWDYCCAPNHRCGYSVGFHKPWCQVGPSQEQWRPCSEKYYPYHQHSVPHPSQGHREDVPRPIRPPARPPQSKPGPWIDPDSADHRPQDYRPGYGHNSHRPSAPDTYLPYEEDRRYGKPDFISSPYLPEADRQYWDNLYKNGPQAYYDGHGNPLPGYVRIPTAERPHIKYHHSYGPAHSEDTRWVPLTAEDEQFLEPPVPGGFGAPRYWPVAYLHKGPPPNTTYFNYQDNHHITSSTERYNIRENAPNIPQNQEPLPDFNRRKSTEAPIIYNNNNIDNQRDKHRDEKTRNLTSVIEDEFTFRDNNLTEITTLKNVIDPKDTKGKVITNSSSADTKVEEKDRSKELIDDKLDDFSSTSIEVLNIDDAKTQKGEKISEIKTLEAEERQIEEIGRLIATRRGGKFVLEKRSQSDLESKRIQISRDFDEPDLDHFNFGSKFVPVSSSKLERRGIVQRVPKDYVDAVKSSASKSRQTDQSLEVSETGYVTPKSNNVTDIKQAIVNGRIFYDATINEKDKFSENYYENRRNPKFIKVPEIVQELKIGSTIPPKSYIHVPIIKLTDESQLEIATTSPTYGQRTTKARIFNATRKGRRYNRRKYDPEEVRKRLLEREKSKEIE